MSATVSFQERYNAIDHDAFQARYDCLQSEWERINATAQQPEIVALRVLVRGLYNDSVAEINSEDLEKEALSERETLVSKISMLYDGIAAKANPAQAKAKAKAQAKAEAKAQTKAEPERKKTEAKAAAEANAKAPAKAEVPRKAEKIARTAAAAEARAKKEEEKQRDYPREEYKAAVAFVKEEAKERKKASAEKAAIAKAAEKQKATAVVEAHKDKTLQPMNPAFKTRADLTAKEDYISNKRDKLLDSKEAWKNWPLTIGRYFSWRLERNDQKHGIDTKTFSSDTKAQITVKVENPAAANPPPTDQPLVARYGLFTPLRAAEQETEAKLRAKATEKKLGRDRAGTEFENVKDPEKPKGPPPTDEGGLPPSSGSRQWGPPRR